MEIKQGFTWSGIIGVIWRVVSALKWTVTHCEELRWVCHWTTTECTPAPSCLFCIPQLFHTVTHSYKHAGIWTQINTNTKYNEHTHTHRHAHTHTHTHTHTQHTHTQHLCQQADSQQRGNKQHSVEPSLSCEILSSAVIADMRLVTGING